jgi:hypothetical protein
MGHWHPILGAVEREPGEWILNAQTGPYAVVRLVEIGGERGYRAVTHAEPRSLIGYRRTLRAACELAHHHFIRHHGPHTNPEQIYPDFASAHR